MIAFLIAEFYFDGLYRIISFVLSIILEILALESTKRVSSQENTGSKTAQGGSVVTIKLSVPEPVVEDHKRPLETEKGVAIASSMVERSETQSLRRTKRFHKHPTTFSINDTVSVNLFIPVKRDASTNNEETVCEPVKIGFSVTTEQGVFRSKENTVQEITTYPFSGPINIHPSVPVRGCELPTIEEIDEEKITYPDGGPIKIDLSPGPIYGLSTVEEEDEIEEEGPIYYSETIDDEQKSENKELVVVEPIMNPSGLHKVASSSLLKYNPGSVSFPTGITPVPVTWKVIGKERIFIRREISSFPASSPRGSFASAHTICSSTNFARRPSSVQCDIVLSSAMSNAVGGFLGGPLRKSTSYPVSDRSVGGNDVMMPACTSLVCQVLPMQTLSPGDWQGDWQASFPLTGSFLLRAFAQTSRGKESSSGDLTALETIQKQLTIHLHKHAEVQACAEKATLRLHQIWTRAYNAAYRRRAVLAQL